MASTESTPSKFFQSIENGTKIIHEVLTSGSPVTAIEIETQVAVAGEEFLLTRDWLELIQVPLAEIGYPIEPEKGEILDDDSHTFRFSRINAEDGYIALLNLPLTFDFHFLHWMAAKWKENDTRAIILFSRSKIGLDFNRVATGIKKTWKFYIHFFDVSLYDDWKNLSDETTRKKRITQDLKNLDPPIFIPRYIEKEGLVFPELGVDSEDFKSIVTIMQEKIRNARSSEEDRRKYISNFLLNRTNWPQDWKEDANIENDEESDILIRRLLIYALGQGKMKDSKNTALGVFLQPYRKVLGDKSAKIEELIAKYRLYPDPGKADE